jgi:hypothetical protein
MIGGEGGVVLLTDYRLGMHALLILGRMLRRLRSLISPAVTRNEKTLVFLLGNGV